MRTRLIRPGFFKNEDLAELPWQARILFPGLWCLADKEGRLEDRPKRIKSEILPYDDCDCDTLLTALHNAGFIHRYTVEGTKYIAILTWPKHQSPHKTEAPSVIPPPDNGDLTVKQPLDNDAILVINTNTNTLTPLTGVVGGNSNGTPTELRKKAPAKELRPVPKPASLFDQWWEIYPKRLGTTKGNKGNARTAFNKLTPQVQRLALEAVKKYVQCEEVRRENGKYIPDAVRWITGERWEDTYQTGPSTNSDYPPPGHTFEKDEYGRWKPMQVDPATGLWPYGCATRPEAEDRNQEARQAFIEARDALRVEGAIA
jgi:hypothetical protein